MSPILTADWWLAAGIRALKTFAQTVLALVAVEMVSLGDVPWVTVLSGAALAAVLSLCTSLAGLPELAGGGTGRHRAAE